MRFYFMEIHLTKLVKLNNFDDIHYTHVLSMNLHNIVSPHLSDELYFATISTNS